MNKTDDLFKLIKVMSKSEKGYFKKFVGGFSSGKDNNYLLLFDLLDKPTRPTDKQIEKYFTGKKKKVNLRALRRYLYQLLLKSLRLYNEKDNYRFDATNRINEIEILMDKGFENEAYILSQQSVEHCTKYELNALKLVFLSYAHLTFGDDIGWDDLPAERERVRQEIHSTTRQIEYVTEIVHLELSIIYLANSYFPTNDAGKLAELEQMVQHEVLKDVSKLTALEAILGYHNVWRVYHALKGNAKQAFEHATQIPSLIEKRKAINKNFIGRYARGVLNEAKLAADVGDPKQAWALLEKLKALPIETPGDKVWLKISHIVGLIHYLKVFPTYRADSKKLAQYAENNYLTTEIFSDDYKLMLTYDLAAFYFLAGDLGKSLDLLGIILNRKPGGGKGMFVHARLLQIVIHYEMGNKLLLPSLMKSTYRYMAKADITFEFERIILRFFTRVLRPSNHVVLKDELEWVKNELQKASLTEYERTPLRAFNYIGWLTQKAEAKN